MLTAGIFLLPNGTFFVELAVFLVLICLIAKYVLPPLNKAMERRQEHIRTSLEAADAARADAAAADDERRHALEEARQQAREIVARANRTAEQVRSEAQARGQAEYDRILAQCRRRGGRARPPACGRGGRQPDGRASCWTSVERVIGREVDAETHRDLIDEAVAALTADARRSHGRAGSRP